MPLLLFRSSIQTSGAESRACHDSTDIEGPSGPSVACMPRVILQCEFDTLFSRRTTSFAANGGAPRPILRLGLLHGTLRMKCWGLVGMKTAPCHISAGKVVIEPTVFPPRFHLTAGMKGRLSLLRLGVERLRRLSCLELQWRRCFAMFLPRAGGARIILLVGHLVGHVSKQEGE